LYFISCLKKKTHLYLIYYCVNVQSLLVLVALFACVFAEAQDQEAAEQYFRYSLYKFTIFSKICQLIRKIFCILALTATTQAGTTVSMEPVTLEFALLPILTTPDTALTLLMPTTLATTTTDTPIKKKLPENDYIFISYLIVPFVASLWWCKHHAPYF